MVEGSLDLSQFEALTFDCYGTLIDWETGILHALRAALGPRANVADDELLEAFAANEAALERGPYLPYREILEGCLRGIASRHGIAVDDETAATFGGSVADWPAFPDSTVALQQLAGRYRLGVLTNCDDDLFAASNRRLRVAFDWVVTAQQAGSYKPSHRNFELLFDRVGLPRERILHVAQSLFHDHVPAHALGLATAWIDRRHGRPGHGATPPASASPDVTAPDLATFARFATA
ncbi:MAG TPA: haloacid dehalogenase type II [Candidatus Limnocylindrales bacterium]